MPDVLFVCSGNTCRSPMAECLFNDFCVKNGLAYRAESAGLYAQEGTAASNNAFYAMKELGLNLSRHVARPINYSLVRDTKLVVAMAESYAHAILARYPDANVVAFHPPVNDPYGESIAVYREIASDLGKRMQWVLNKLTEAEKTKQPGN
ncbi:MAG: hypothetical protein PHY64_10290 [Eubacteriales bacterium]|nr:hypothetical protein [Eubacteriales bacterium]